MNTTIHPFPELVAYAHRAADDLHARMGLRLSGGGVEALRAAVLSQSCDLTRPASLDAVCRLVADRLNGWVTATVIHAIETTGAIRARLHRDLGMSADVPTSTPAPEALAAIVRHLWPEVSDGR